MKDLKKQVPMFIFTTFVALFLNYGRIQNCEGLNDQRQVMREILLAFEIDDNQAQRAFTYSLDLLKDKDCGVLPF